MTRFLITLFAALAWLAGPLAAVSSYTNPIFADSKHNDNFNRQSQQVPYDWIRRVMLQEIGWRTHGGRLVPDFFAKPIIGVGETMVPGAVPLTYHFDDGTYQGWTSVATDSRQFFALAPPVVSSPNGTPQSGSHFIGLHLPAFGGSPFYFQDSAHATLVLRSPGFTLNGAGGLSAWLCGGGPGSPNLAGTAVSALPANSSNGGFRGIALRNATTGQFVLSASKTSDGNEWQQVGFSAAQLAALPEGHTYTLDFIDAAEGGWGWVNIDSVSIPGSPVLPPDPFLDWAAAKGLSGPVAAFNGDPDGDGIANGLEFVLGGEPNSANPGPNSLSLLPTAQANGNALVFTFQRNKRAAYLNPTVSQINNRQSPLRSAPNAGAPGAADRCPTGPERSGFPPGNHSSARCRIVSRAAGKPEPAAPSPWWPSAGPGRTLETPPSGRRRQAGEASPPP